MATFFISFSTQRSFGTVLAQRRKYLPLRITVTASGGGGKELFLTATYSPSSPLLPVTVEPVMGWDALPIGGTSAARLHDMFSISSGGSVNRTVFLCYRPPAAAASQSGTLTVRLVAAASAGNPERVLLERSVNVDGAAIGSVPAKVALVIDRSASMNAALGSATRFSVARSAALTCMTLMENSDHAGIVSFAESASPDVPVAQLSAAQRSLMTSNLTAAVTPRDKTSIQTGVATAAAAITGTADQNMIFFTDGIDDIPPALSSSLPGDRFAIGLNTSSTAALQTLVGGAAGKSVLVTDASDPNLTFRIQKYAAQVLLDIHATSASMVVDPDGVIGDAPVRYQVPATELDRQFDVVVLSPKAELLQMRLLAPAHDPELAVAEPARAFREIACHSLQDEPGPRRAPGLAVATYNVNAAELRPSHSEMTVEITRRPGVREERPLKFSMFVVARTDLILDAALHASSLIVGGQLLLSAVVKEGGVAIPARGEIIVELTQPDGIQEVVKLREASSGRFSARIQAFRPGIYEAHFIATGHTLQGRRFQREALRMLEILSPRAESCCSK